MSVIDAVSTAEINLDQLPALAHYIASGSGGNELIQISDSGSIQQNQDGPTYVQVSAEGSLAPVVQFADQTQGIYITEGFPQGIQIVDGSFPLVQGADGTSILQLGPQVVSGSNLEGLTQVVQFAGGQIALIEQQENIDPQNVQFVLEQVPVQHASQLEGDMQQQQQQLMDTEAPLPKTELPSALVDDIMKPPVGKGPYYCEICDKKLEKWPQYLRHMKTHDDDKPFRCFNCPATFNIADNLKLHLATHVEPGDKPVCPDCGKKFTRVASLKAHIMMHEKEESLMCTECGDEFGTQTHLDRHMLEHKEDREGTRVFSCKQCNAQFSTRPELKEHTKQHFKIKHSLSHRTYKREIDRTSFSNKCTHCNKTFQKPSQLERHIRVHTGDRPFKCELCTKAFNQKGALQMHILGKHTDKKPHKCEFCQQTFSQRGNLRAHVQRVHTLTEGQAAELGKTVYSCSECSCMFKKLGSLNAHISRFHTVCNENDKSQAKKEKEDGQENDDVIDEILGIQDTSIQTPTQDQAQQLPRDDILQQALQNSGVPGTNDKGVETGKPGGTLSVMNVRDTATGTIKKHYVRKVGNISWHQCNFCTKEFKKPSDLVRHTRIHSHEKPYKCTQCFRAFAVKSTLNSHIRTHMGIKQFLCSVCEKSFSTHGSLKVHLRLHTGAKPFSCEHCEQKFRTPAHLKTHTLSHFKSSEKGPVRMKTDPAYKKLSKDLLPDVPMQEPILITDTGLIQQPPRSSMFNQQYLGESGSVDRPYKCPHCHRGFKKSSHLKQHIRSHTGEKPFKCLTCGRSFVSNGVLKAHIRIHTGAKQYKCLMCDNLFSTNGSLKRHMSTHSDVRPFMCPYCQRVFKTSVNCKKHMKTHRHELAMQSVAAATSQIQDPDNVAQSETVISSQPGTEYVEEEAVDNDLTLVQHNLEAGGTGDMGQAGMLHTGLHELGLTSTNLDQQILNQQMFGGQQQTFTQSLLGTGQQSFQQVNNQLALSQQPNQYIQSQNQLELGYQQTQESLQELQASTEHIPESQTVHHVPISGTMDHAGNIQGLEQAHQQTSGLEQTVQTVTLGHTSMGTEVQGTSLLQNNAALGNSTMNEILHNGETMVTEEDLVAGEVNDEAGGQYEDDEAPEGLENDEGGDEGSQDEDPTYSQDGRNFPCQLCEKAYKKHSHLKQHMRSHTGEKPYKCSQCDKSFVTMSVLRNHLRTHTGLKEFKCSVCHALFTTNGSLTRHMNIHVSIKPYKCPFCLEGFRTAWTCKKHMSQHENEVSGPGPESDEGLGAPVQQTGRGRRPVVKLVNVEEVVVNQSADIQEISTDMNMSEKILQESAAERERISEVKEDQGMQSEQKHAHQCNHCTKSFKKPSDLVRHIRIHTGEKPFNCTTCQRTFTVKSTLDSHMKTHGIAEKTIRCHICNSMFSTKGSLKVHMRLHTGAKPFKCPHCPARFRTSGHRKSHILQHYKPENGTLRRKRANLQTIVQEVQSEPMDFINQTQPAQQDTQQTVVQGQGQLQMGQVINLDQSILGNNVMPMSLTVDGFGNLTDNLVGAHVIQGMDGIQLQVAGGNIAQGIQITGFDPNTMGQALQIDASVLQQLQSGNFNLTLNPNQLQMADPNMVQNLGNLGNLQVQPINIQEGVNPNLVIQPIGGMGVDQASMALASQNSQMGLNQDMAAGTQPGTFVMANNSIIVDQQQESQQQAQVIHTSVGSAGQTATMTTQNLMTEQAAMTQTTDYEQDAGNIGAMDTTIGMNGTMMANDAGQASDNEDDGDDIVDDIAMDEDGPVTVSVEHADGQGAGMGGAEVDLSGDLTGEGVVQNPVGDDINQDQLHDQSMEGTQMVKPQMLVLNQSITSHQHKGTNAGVDDLKSLKCSVCNKVFKRTSNLKEHMQIHMKGEGGDRRSATKMCMYCSKTFQKPSQLERHLRIHTGERPFACSMCDKSFNQKNALQMHIKKHSGDKQHQCPYCPIAFVQKGNLKTHIKRSHNGEMLSSMTNKTTGLEGGNQGQDGAAAGTDGGGDAAQPAVNQELSLNEVVDLF